MALYRSISKNPVELRKIFAAIILDFYTSSGFIHDPNFTGDPGYFFRKMPK
jgi:hypothetical protein